MKQRIVIGSIGALIAALTLGSARAIAAQFGGPPPTGAAAMKEAASRPTPKRPNGVPDFTGIWVQTRSRADNIAALDKATGNYKNVLQGRTGNPVDFERDSGVSQRVIPREARPWYKPQYWERVQFNDVHGHSPKAPDPDFLCMPAGVPRIGIPQEIVQTDTPHDLHLPAAHPPRLHRWPRASPGRTVARHVAGALGRPLGRRHARHLDRRLQRAGVARLARLVHEPGQAGNRAHAARRKHADLGSRGRPTRCCCSRGRPGQQTRMLNPDPRAEIEEPLPCVERDLQHIVTRERG